MSATKLATRYLTKPSQSGIFRDTAKGAKEPLFSGQTWPECGWRVRETNRKIDDRQGIAEFFENRLCRTFKRNFKRKLLLA
jgi:hypothetical protein